MDWTIIPADGWAFLAAAAGGLVLGFITTTTASKDSPAWPLRLYLALFASSRTLPALQRYAKERKSFSFREQLFAAWFVWFFILFLIVIVVLSP